MLSGATDIANRNKPPINWQTIRFTLQAYFIQGERASFHDNLWG